MLCGFGPCRGGTGCERRGVVEFVEDLRWFTRRTLYRRARGLVVRTWRRLLEWLRPSTSDHPSGFQKGHVMAINLGGGQTIKMTIARIEGNTVFFDEDVDTSLTL